MASEDDLTAYGFVSLRRAYFLEGGAPRGFDLRDKRQTQDDPLDEHVHATLADALAVEGIRVQKAPGPLISPDLALLRSAEVQQKVRDQEQLQRSDVVGLEVKKLERTRSGRVARASGLDYNTTPPSERISVRLPGGEALDIPSSYLFVVLETSGSQRAITSLVLCDGALLNEDVELYRSVVGERTKIIGLGSYGDAVDRQRPMLIFANPLSVNQLDAAPTLVSAHATLADTHEELEFVGNLHRTRRDGTTSEFYCYRCEEDAGRLPGFELRDPFPEPARTEQTQSRGRFTLDL